MPKAFKTRDWVVISDDETSIVVLNLAQIKVLIHQMVEYLRLTEKQFTHVKVEENGILTEQVHELSRRERRYLKLIWKMNFYAMHNIRILINPATIRSF